MTAPSGDQQPDPMQFDAAEPVKGTMAGDRVSASISCSNCQRVITTSYHTLNAEVICGACRAKLERELRGSGAGGRMGSAVLWGLGGGIVGSIAYYAVAAITGFIVGIVAIAVGWLVGKGVSRGSAGRGGLAYQVLAVVITWFSIASAYIPLAISELRSQGTLGGGDVSRAASGGKGEDAVADSLAATEEEDAAADDTAAKADVSTGDFIKAIFILLALIAAIPIIGNGPIGWLIVGFGIFEAWKLNKGVPIAFSGPFKVGNTPAPA